jgi:hypothetical protein
MRSENAIRVRLAEYTKSLHELAHELRTEDPPDVTLTLNTMGYIMARMRELIWCLDDSAHDGYST